MNDNTRDNTIEKYFSVYVDVIGVVVHKKSPQSTKSKLYEKDVRTGFSIEKHLNQGTFI